jgi:uncharacterized protein YgiM (DUF1202 family)
MKKQIWAVFVATISTTLLAQTNTPVAAPSAAAPAPVMTTVPAAVDTNEPAAKPSKWNIFPHKKHKAAAAIIAEPPVTLVPGPAEVGVSNINVRGQASLKGEVIAHFFMGDTVTVLEQINLHKHKAGELAQWAKIAFPTNAYVWVNAKYIDESNKTVLPKKLNLRAGPGENYSVVGLIKRGTPVSEVSNKGNWMKIEPPASAYAFVAAMYLKQEAVASAPANAAPPMETGPAPTPVAESQPIVTEPTNAPAAPETNAAVAAAVETNAPAEVDTNLPPPPPRVVTHEGFVRHVTSIIAPTAYELYDTNTFTVINYLYTTTTNLNLSRYNGLHIIVTGEEGLAERWKDTPVLTVQRIHVVE